MMRMLHVGSGNLFGGVETLLCGLAEHDARSPRRGTNGHFALCFEGRLSDRLQALGAQVYSLGEVCFRNPVSMRRARRALAALLREERFDAAICHSVWAQALFGGIIRDAGLTSLFWLHGAARGDGWLERLASRSRPDFVIANSHYTNGTLDRLYPGVSSAVLYPPLDVLAPPLAANERTELRRDCETATDAVVIVQSSRMEPWKGHRQLLAALARLIDDPRWVCWIAGSAQREQEEAYVRDLRATAESLGVATRVRFLGQRTDIPRLLAAADVHCQPNVEAEPFGVVFIEALSAGRPVVTTDLGGAREIVDDSCGILVPPGDTARLAESLRRLIDEPELRASLGGHGPARARQLCDPQRQLSRLDDICARACGDARSRSTKAPWWLATASTVIRRLPAGRYRASGMLARVAVRPFMTRTPALLGALAFHVDWDDQIARDVCLMGVYEPQETALLRALLRRGMTCVDVGANWGYFTLLAAHLTGEQGTVVALEPDPRLVPTLRRNVDANGLDQVEVLPLAASDACGSCWLEGHDRRSGNLGTSHLVHAVRDGVSSFRVETSTIDALLDERNVESVDLLKMDIEGGEALALRGMRDGLAARRYTRLLLELHPTMLGEHGSSVAEVVATMRGAGYRGWWIDHSAQAVRRASYARRVRPSDYLRPIDERASEVAWPHTLWVAPHAAPTSRDA